ncbi:MAG: hypothetical protein ACT4PZ_16295 [Panacagrimonas sp.]
MTRPTTPQLAILAGLVLLMLVTRFDHFFSVPDASWAVFFIGGFYLRGLARWAFPALTVEAVLIDWFATQQFGISAYCLTPAYAFLIPAHAVLWFGGAWLRTRQQLDLRSLALFATAAFVSVTAAYAISNGSFYWLGGRQLSAPNLAGYLANFSKYYVHFLTIPCAYLAATGLVHVGITWSLRHGKDSSHPQSRS